MNTIVCVPFTGLGLYGGFRGNRWLRNRIKIFRHFVFSSLMTQSDKKFILWVAWREEERGHPQVEKLLAFLRKFAPFPVVFTYTGCPMWDDKYPDDVARDRLVRTLMGALPDLMELTAGEENIYWLLQPSDDCYDYRTIANVKKTFEDRTIQAVSYVKGYLCNYNTLETLEYNPKTNPPFFAIKYPRAVFFDPGKHMNYTGPFKSHEYIADKLKMAYFDYRGFLVGTHGENISTHFNHPYGGASVPKDILANFGLSGVSPLTLPISTRKWLMRKLPYQWQRKLRYWFGELFYSRFYNWIRN